MELYNLIKRIHRIDKYVAKVSIITYFNKEDFNMKKQ